MPELLLNSVKLAYSISIMSYSFFLCNEYSGCPANHYPYKQQWKKLL